MYSLEIKNLVIEKLIQNVNKIQISNETNVSIGTIHNWSITYANNIINKVLLLEHHHNKKIHGLNKKNQYIHNIIEYINSNNNCSLDEISTNVTNNRLSKSLICKILKENNILKKRKIIK
jgi:hypothetical protein